MSGFIAPVFIYPGEDEMRALAQNGALLLKGQIKAKEYCSDNVVTGLDLEIRWNNQGVESETGKTFPLKYLQPSSTNQSINSAICGRTHGSFQSPERPGPAFPSEPIQWPVHLR